MIKNYAVLLLLSVLMLGCSTPEHLKPPSRIPVFVQTYEKSALAGLKTLECSLNLVNCADESILTRRTFSGMIEPLSKFPIRDVVQFEFESVVRSNFMPVTGGAQPVIEMKVESQRIVLQRDGDEIEFSLVLIVSLLNPMHEDKPYFSKRYSVDTFCESDNDELIPNCVYEAVQLVASKFLADLSAEGSLVSRLPMLKRR